MQLAKQSTCYFITWIKSCRDYSEAVKQVNPSGITFNLIITCNPDFNMFLLFNNSL